MQIINADLMQEMRDARRCHLCGGLRNQGEPLHPHHVRKRGTGGGSRLDVRENLMGVHWTCHNSIENGHVPLLVQWACIAAREKKTIDEVSSFVNALVNAPKEAVLRDGKLHVPAWARQPGLRSTEGLHEGPGTAEPGRAG